MAVVRGVNCGFVSSAPSGDPAGSATGIEDEARALKDTSPAGAAKVTEIGWWCDNATEEANFEVGIYDHNVGDDNPEAVVGLHQTNAKGTSGGWKRRTGLNISITPSTVYWIAVQLDNTATGTMSDYTAVGGSKSDRKLGQAALTDPWGVSDEYSNILTAIYAVWESAAAGEERRSGSLCKNNGFCEENASIEV